MRDWWTEHVLGRGRAAPARTHRSARRWPGRVTRGTPWREPGWPTRSAIRSPRLADQLLCSMPWTGQHSGRPRSQASRRCSSGSVPRRSGTCLLGATTGGMQRGMPMRLALEGSSRRSTGIWHGRWALEGRLWTSADGRQWCAEWCANHARRDGPSPRGRTPPRRGLRPTRPRGSPHRPRLPKGQAESTLRTANHHEAGAP